MFNMNYQFDYKSWTTMCYGDIPYDVTTWALLDTINSDWLDKQGK